MVRLLWLKIEKMSLNKAPKLKKFYAANANEP
jgi:hypothetical protein